MHAEPSRSWESAVRWLLEQPDQAEFVRACYYDRPAAAAAKRFHESEEWAATRALMPPSRGSALDIGAGNGIASHALARDGWSVTAAEPDRSDLVGAGAIRALAEATGLSIRTVEERGERLPVDDGSFDLVYGRAVLHHANDLARFCSELFRVLKPGGTLLAAREHVVSSSRQLTQFLASHRLHRLYGGENALPRGAYLRALHGAGFEVTRVLGPLESPINYAPRDRAMLRRDIASILQRVVGVSAASWVVNHNAAFAILLSLGSIVDRRPGRLFTFVARKPVVQ